MAQDDAGEFEHAILFLDIQGFNRPDRATADRVHLRNALQDITGALLSELKRDFVSIDVTTSGAFDFDGVNAVLADLRGRCEEFLATAGSGSKPLEATAVIRCVAAEMSAAQAVDAGFTPFIVGGLVKAAIAGVLSLIAFYFVTTWLMPDNAIAATGNQRRHQARAVSCIARCRATGRIIVSTAPNSM